MKTLTFLTLFSASWFALTGQTQSTSLQQQLETIVLDSNLNGSVLVSYQGETHLKSGYGYANHQKNIRNTPSTEHRIGSITKQFTAMAILILEEQKKLTTQAKVGDYLREVPKTWQSLTLHQLLTHTSGLIHSWSAPAFSQNGIKRKTLDETLELFYDHPLTFDPGEGFLYSGVGYFLLAKVIESVSGQSYEVFLRNQIFRPLDMNHTGCDHPDRQLEDASTGYQTNRQGNRRVAPDFYMPLLTGGGNLFSTVQDLEKWHHALQEQKLVSKASYRKLYQTERRNYAYGWTVRTLNGERWVYHGGGVPGHSSFILRNPDKQLCVVIMSNHRTARMQATAMKLARAVLNQSDE